MTKKGNIWIVPHKDGWAVKREKAERSTVVTPTKEKAVKIGNKIGEKDGVTVIVQKRNGEIQSNDSHGHDPNPPKDKEH